jgi:plastocyanin
MHFRHRIHPSRPGSAHSSTLFAIAAGLVVALAACSSNSGASTAASQGAASQGAASQGATSSGGTVVKLSGFQFDPTTLTIPVGTKVTFQNMDGTEHTVTNGKDGTPEATPLFDHSLPAGATFEFTFTKAGTVNVTCKIHSSMNLTITVQ